MNDSWKSTALKRQLAFKSRLGLTESGFHGGKTYPHILSDEDAASGANFFCYGKPDLWEEMQIWAKFYC